MPVIAGPTASGKSFVALSLAREHGLEIVSADAMQVYRGMDIGTAKPTSAERREVPHHLLDVVTPAERFSVADYVRLAEAALAEVLARARTPLVVGGTGFYLKALGEGLPQLPPADRTAQTPLWDLVAAGRLDSLVAELRAAAPQDADRAGVNPRRVVRAVEVLRRTGRPPSSFPPSTPRFSYRTLVLLPPAAELKARAAERTRSMFATGLVAEVETLLRAYPEQPTALQAIGYKEVAAHLRGECSLGEAIDEVTRATQRYAKRQRTWFKAERSAAFLAASGEEAYAAAGRWLRGESSVGGG